MREKLRIFSLVMLLIIVALIFMIAAKVRFDLYYGGF